jgi:hypothetical protein
MPVETATGPIFSTRLFWCPHCGIFVAAHPLDHLDDAHPPQHADGSHALPERLAW